MDSDGYPTDEELDRIRAWPYQDFVGLLRFAGEMFTESGFGKFVQSGNEFRLITGGWSGNEEVCEALQQNKAFWTLCWQATHRGGLDVFKVPESLNTQSL